MPHPRRLLATSAAAVLRVAIIQSGLFNAFIWESTMDMVVKKNPDVQFDWYVELQHRADWADDAKRWGGNQGNTVHTSEADVQRFRDACAALVICHVAHYHVKTDVF
jgi:hypothetical protein